MSDANMAGLMQQGLIQHWVAVTDADGGTHLEAHWLDASSPTHVTHAA